MDYKVKYNAALERARQFSEHPLQEDSADIVEYIFPELKESEDERIRKGIIDFIKQESDIYGIKTWFHGYTTEEIVAWLEKQSQQTHVELGHSEVTKTSDQELEPKFKVGDWLQYRNAEPFLVEEIIEQGYCNGNSCLPFEWEDEIHLWDIQDAEDGDVLVDVYGNIGIFKKCYDFDWMSYCSLGCNGGFQNFKVEHENENTHPATKEQRDLLFQKMADAGYEWDAQKKELKKMKVANKEIDDAYLQGM